MMTRLVKAQDRKIQSAVLRSNAIVNDHDCAGIEIINQNIA